MATANTTSKTTNDDLDAVKADLQALRDDVGQLTSSLQAMLKDEASAIAKQAGQRASAMNDQAQAVVQENPLQSVGIAFAAGFVLGKLLSH